MGRAVVLFSALLGICALCIPSSAVHAQAMCGAPKLPEPPPAPTFEPDKDAPAAKVDVPAVTPDATGAKADAPAAKGNTPTANGDGPAAKAEAPAASADAPAVKADAPAATPGAPAAKAGIGKLPHLIIDVKNKTIRMECMVCNTSYGLEFFCVSANTNEYESVLSSQAKGSDLHTALLMLGLKPGKPVRFSEATQKWLPPEGPPLDISCEFDKNGKHYLVPAYRVMRNVKTKKECAPFTWVFTGSKVMDDGKYAADVTGYLASVLNNELTVIDIPALVGRAMETREWEPNTDLLPAVGSKVWMIIEPAGKTKTPKLDAPKADAGNEAAPKPNAPKADSDKSSAAPGDVNTAVADAAATTGGDMGEAAVKQPATKPIDDVHIDQAKIDKLKSIWEKAVAPHKAAMAAAAQAHYEVIDQLRGEQQRLIDEADRIQRVIDQLQKEYQDMTTPRPE